VAVVVVGAAVEVEVTEMVAVAVETHTTSPLLTKRATVPMRMPEQSKEILFKEMLKVA